MADTILTLSNGDTVIVPETGRRNVQFFINDLYKYTFADTGAGDIEKPGGKYIPKVNDLVYDLPTGEYWVSRVAPAPDYTATLVLRNPAGAGGVDLTKDLYLATGTGYQSESWRLYVDTRTLPHTADIDLGFRSYVAEATKYCIFEGVNTSDQSKIISAYYNQSGAYVGNSIPLELVGTYEPGLHGSEVPVNNINIKGGTRGYVTKALRDGAMVTVVFYSQDDRPLKVAHMLVHITNAVARPHVGRKRVKHIELISSWLSKTEPNTLRIPINATVSTANMVGRVTFVDGTIQDLPVGLENSLSRFKLMNFQYWSPSVQGPPYPLTLTYELAPGEEYSYPQGVTENGLVLKQYSLIGEAQQDAYNLKLYLFPSYVSGTVGYVLQGWMYDMTRSVGRRIPDGAISIVEGFPSFNGKDYMNVQNLRVQVEMKALDVSYGEYKHTQAVQVALLKDGVHPATNWRVKQTGAQLIWFGDGLEAKSWAHSTAYLAWLDLKNGFSDLENWLAAMYYPLDPLYDRATETKAPQPTHFYVVAGQREFLFPIEQWASNLVIGNDPLQGGVTNGGTIYIKWMRRLADRDLQLGVSGLPMKITG